MKKSPVKNRRSADRSQIRQEYQAKTGNNWQQHGSWQNQLQLNTNEVSKYKLHKPRDSQDALRGEYGAKVQRKEAKKKA